MKFRLLVLTVLSSFAVAEAGEPHSYHPPQGMVPDADTAKRIAEAVWLPIYGQTIESEKPFKAHLQKGIWTVEGADLPAGWVGGVAVIEIAKSDGRVLRVSHGR